MESTMMTWAPTIVTRCCGCGLGTNVAREWYRVNDAVWDAAWCGRRKPWHSLPGQEILCVGCLERRLGRTLCAGDFTDAMVNCPKEVFSDRLRQRLMATESMPLEPTPVPADNVVVPFKRKRGRPKGSKNKSKAADPESAPGGRKRGRPKGSKNKPKVQP
jgi:hypothetical protein